MAYTHPAAVISCDCNDVGKTFFIDSLHEDFIVKNCKCFITGLKGVTYSTSIINITKQRRRGKKQ